MERIRKSRRPIGALLLDQRLFAGIGNVYRAEILFLAKVHPLQPGSSLHQKQVMTMWKLACDLLAKGVAANRIVTVPQESGGRVRRSEALFVYGRRSCRTCGGPVLRETLAARTIYACERCQPRHEVE